MDVKGRTARAAGWEGAVFLERNEGRPSPAGCSRIGSKTEPFAPGGVGLPRLPDLVSALGQPQFWFHSSSVV